MNNQSPLIPQGSLLEQKNKGRARAKILILCVLVLHGVGLLALLMQGCGRDTGTSGAGTSNTMSGASSTFADNTTPSNPTPPFAAPSNAATGEAPGATGTTGAPPAAATTTPPPVVENTNLAPVAPPGGPAGGSEYKIVKGDTMAKIAKKSHVSLRALTDANPGVDSTKLKIGQSIHIPAPAATTSTGPTGGTAPAPGATSEGPGGTSYTVKSGDNLLKIANQFGVKVKALRAANNLKTDKIRVGQTLKIPAKPAGTTPTGGTSAAGATTGPAPLPGQ